MLIVISIFTLSFFNKEDNTQCSNNNGIWVGAESSIPLTLLRTNNFISNYKNVYLKSNLHITPVPKLSSCQNVYSWYEDGLSLNFLTPSTKPLVFKEKVDGKYWFDISKEETRSYILKKFKNYNKEYPIHLDDHWSIPTQYGDYTKELDSLTKEVVDIIGPFSLSVLPFPYSLDKYNVNWIQWINKGYISEIILQNYVPKNFKVDLLKFDKQTKDLNIKRSIGLYQRKKSLQKEIDIIKGYDMSYSIFSYRTSIGRDYH